MSIVATCQKLEAKKRGFLPKNAELAEVIGWGFTALGHLEKLGRRIDLDRTEMPHFQDMFESSSYLA